MSGTGIIESEVFRSEQVSLLSRTTDPDNPSTGDLWIREDVQPTEDAIAALRIQGDSDFLEAPIFDAGVEDQLGEDIYPGQWFVFEDSEGFLAVTDQGGNVGSPRLLTSDGTVFEAHDALELSGIPDSGIYDADNWTEDASLFIDSANIDWTDRVTPAEALRGDDYWAILVNYHDGDEHRTSIIVTPDFEGWQESPANPLLENTSEDDWTQGDRAMAGGLTYDETNKEWAILYGAKLNSDYDGIRGVGLATSSDLDSWSKSSENPVVVPSDLGDWGGGDTSDRLYCRGVFQHDGYFYMLAQYGWAEDDDKTAMRAGLLRSSDLVDWTDLDINPIVDPDDSWQSDNQVPESIAKVNDQWALTVSADVQHQEFGFFSSDTLESTFTPSEDNPIKDLSDEGFTSTRHYALVASDTLGALVLLDTDDHGDQNPTSLYKSVSSLDSSDISSSSLDSLPGNSELESILEEWWNDGPTTNKWPMDEGSGTTTQASVGSASGTLTNADWVPDSKYEGGYATDYNGSDAYWQTGSLDINGQEATVAFWVEVSSHDDYARLMSANAGPDSTPEENGGGWDIYFDEAETEIRLVYYTDSDDGAVVEQGDGIPIPTDEDVFIAASISGSDGDLYAYDSDDQIGSRSGTSSIGRDQTDDAVLTGMAGDGRNTGGTLDSVHAVTDTALSESEIEDIWEDTIRN